MTQKSTGTVAARKLKAMLDSRSAAKVADFPTGRPLADRLGILQARLAPMLIEEAELKDMLRSKGPGHYPGRLYDVTVGKPGRREILDMTAVRKKLSPQFIARHTTVTPIKSSVTATARKKP